MGLVLDYSPPIESVLAMPICYLASAAAFDSYLVYAAGVHSPGPLPMGLMPESGKGFAG